MMRKAPATSMQKTYDECYLICSTAIYFESQNNEAEALRAWRNALDQIYYHNAYKIPSNYVPRSETEKALADSLKAMELQCKERVDLLEALKKSKLEAAKAEKEAAGSGSGSPFRSRESLPATPSATANNSNGQGSSWLGNNTVPPATYADIPRPTPTPERRPAPPPRPSYVTKKSSHGYDTPRNMSLQSQAVPGPRLTPPVPVSSERSRDRTPSPDKKNGGMLKTLRAGNAKDGKSSSSKLTTTLRPKPQPAAASAAALSWTKPAPNNGNGAGPSSSMNTSTQWDPVSKTVVRGNPPPQEYRRASDNVFVQPPGPSDFQQGRPSYSQPPRRRGPPYPDHAAANPFANFDSSNDFDDTSMPPPPPPHQFTASPPPATVPSQAAPNIAQMPAASLSYMQEYPNSPPIAKKTPPAVPLKPTERKSDSERTSRKANRIIEASSTGGIPRKAIGRAAGVAAATAERQKLDNVQAELSSRTRQDPRAGPAGYSSSPDGVPRRNATKKKIEGRTIPARAMTPPTTDDADDDSGENIGAPSAKDLWDARVSKIMKNLPKGLDEFAAKQIFNEIVIQGDEVHWDDVAGLEIAKSALKETVVYPFLRPDLFMGLREPARGMLLFGPPGTGKTMLARAVATESKSIFFAISASSLTSKFLGESEKLVRALFVLAKELAPSIIFVDEIDSLLGSRGGSSEHEATRRIKTEFLIQWSNLQKAAAGREATEGDASRVLVLAATNTPWAIDEAARRRFVRRQYIPLPEDWVREKQLRTLLAAQKHNLRDKDLKVLVILTEGFSGSDITALAKDAAMGPLRSLGEKLLHMSPDEIRPIGMQDFEASLVNIRPSVSKQGLKEFEDWAREFGERGG
ncbi:Protein SAP1 [Cercospora beticola]|uniref:Protein SAP1 n=1 Tax=Cercospora beticola TaxID=122368 RepID=A0A2G5HX18_CERBT|nr:Protein SAP1 [Cercospora beticola]PIA97078.1 Protein SAP1 [Cercospora beticola]WPA98316.1 hypothetical protein RHO25_002928 [Cercospora beticola]